ncbi:hypothetical protein D3C83_232570 [compost metagenome]
MFWQDRKLADDLRQFTVSSAVEMEGNFAFAGLFSFGNLSIARSGLRAVLLEGVK